MILKSELPYTKILELALSVHIGLYCPFILVHYHILVRLVLQEVVVSLVFHLIQQLLQDGVLRFDATQLGHVVDHLSMAVTKEMAG